ncbi:MAG: GWxTD domain-containing protein [Bacteroidales bacterium]|nr:GWxTD domain-containing protein [Bacteroidales bacterium]
MNKYIQLLLIISISIFCVSCKILNQEEKEPVKKISTIATGTSQLAQIYNPKSTTIHPKVFAQKNNSQDIDLYVIISDSELLFSKTTNGSIARVKIFYKIMESYENSALVDSCLKVINIPKGKTSKTYAIKLKVKEVELEKYVIQTTITDLNRGKMNINFVEIDKNNLVCSDNYKILYYENSQPYKELYADLNTELIIQNENADKLYYKYIKIDETIPTTPYYYTNPDSIINCEITEKSNTFNLTIDKPGIYYITKDTTQNQGYSLPCFGNDHPNVTTPEDMIKPLKYLTQEEEYQNIANSPTKKLAIDDFWLGCTKDVKKAKEMIKIYYTRAVFANLYFTTYKQGMLTDRGMVYIVLGPPQNLALTTKAEIWTYIDRKQNRKYRFEFRKKSTNLYDNDYQLNRSSEFKPYWDKAVAAWRNGTLYTY